MGDDDRHPLRRRNPELVVALLGYIYDHDDPVPWLDTVDRFTNDGRPWKTVENTIYDLIAFGALHRVGKPGQRGTPDTRALRPTPLGRAWLERTLLPLPRNENP
jgi:hypothetical protein